MDLEYWESISRQDLLKFVENQRERNVKLKTSVEKDDDFESAGGLCATAHLPEMFVMINDQMIYGETILSVLNFNFSI